MESSAGRRRSGWLLAALGTLSLSGYAFASLGLPTSGSSRDLMLFLGLFATLFGVYFATVAVFGRTASGATTQILAWAFLFRLALLPAGLPGGGGFQDLAADLGSREVVYSSFLLYDNDVWRYLWDGHVSASGFDPYAHSPADLEALADGDDPRALALFDEELWQDVFDRVSYGGYRTVYPPAAQWLFRLAHALAPGSVIAWKLLLALFDFGTCLLLAALLRSRGGQPAAVVVYAWNPLVLKEIAGSGHLDAVMIFFLAASVYCLDRGFQRAGLLAYGLAILAKVTPVLLLPLYLRRLRPRQELWVLAATLAAGYLPFLGSLATMARSLLAFSREWVFNPGPWLLAKWIADQLPGVGGAAAARLLALTGTLSLVVWAWRRDDGGSDGLIRGSFLVLGGFLVFSAAVMPWYLLWVLPYAALRLGRPEATAWLALTALSLLSYLIYVDQIEHRWWLWVEYLGFFGVLTVAFRASGQAKRPPGRRLSCSSRS